MSNSKMDEEKLKALLLETNEEFKRVYEQHQNYERDLGELQSKSFLSEEEKIQIVKLKKKKLKLKDKLYAVMSEYRKSHNLD
ncbi:MAG: DUF465 domain-containing protein [Candidatus Aminicenantes bacterium]